jgi:hypothetical protein
MHLDDSVNSFLVIGYDLRLWNAGDNHKNPSIHISADPTIWVSARELSIDSVCAIYGVKRLSDISNGVNLEIFPPPGPAPDGFIWSAFDAPEKIVKYMADSFGLQHSLQCKSKILYDEGFSLVGYDVIDLWTQTSALFKLSDLNHISLTRNSYGLFSTPAFAYRACTKADELYPAQSPFQPVGIWILYK